MTASTTRRTTAARGRLAAVGAIAAAGALVLSACGDQTDDAQSEDTGKKDSAAASKYDLPANVKKAGVIKVGSDIAYAPMEFDEAGKPVGVDVDVAAALGKELGVSFKFENGVFDNLIPSLETGRHDVIMSAMSDTKERQAKVDFVDYFSAGVSILAKKGNPEGIKSVEDLCGKTIAFQRGTVSADVAKAANEKCPAGKKIKTLTFDTDPEALLQVKQGRAVADLNDFPVAAYNAQKSGDGKDFEVVGDQVGEGPYGIAVTKDNTQLRDAIAKAMDAIIANGEYAKVLEKWNVAQGAVEKAVVNGGAE
ncbi:Membrane-bound lytic murein transglycosylase F [Streptomyces sp. RB5]|uniref:Membrane-bound lytic murein transglycosylase F n=1 Tax=Streptomyces smaragdinus TaxID=2585196 RepID=A0A7K0CJK4_9ACTN|nr:ABC transporter substrate-binding protein [Streptomyces smaragdinus]MQY13647.1 Membrane-bound lytic murein transglycosylase F [Streptomyces smaragdinus]